MTPRVIVHIDMDAFFAAVEVRDNPHLKGKPVIIGADPKKGRGRGVVSTCSYEARKFGIHSAMPISQAYRLCPQGIYLPPNGRKYRLASQQILKILNDFTPDVEPISIDEAFLDMTGCIHFYGSAIEAARRIKNRIKEDVNLTASIGIAPNKMTAKIASDLGKPDGLLEVREENLQRFLSILPVERLWGVGEKTKSSLNKLGIYKIGDLAVHSEEVLVKLLGEHGRHLHFLANGVDERPVYLTEDVKSVSHEHTFDEDTSDRDEVNLVLAQLTEKVSRRLRKNDLKGRVLSVKIRTKGFHTFLRSYTFMEHQHLFEPIYQKAKEIFYQFYREGMKIRLIGVRLADFHQSYAQETLFPHPQNEKREKVSKAMDLIKDKFGETSISMGASLK
jgi:nucleotidyltransferase/DNA polymerase involved in DNA repair